MIAYASGPLDWARYRDTNADELAALLQTKIANQPPIVSANEPVAVLHLLDALEQSVAAATSAAPRNGKAHKSRSGRVTA